jgi:hypothetical protein
MGLFRDLAHIVGIITKVNVLWCDVRMILIRQVGVDIEKLPDAYQLQLYRCVKHEYLNGNTSAESIAQLVKHFVRAEHGRKDAGITGDPVNTKIGSRFESPSPHPSTSDTKRFF